MRDAKELIGLVAWLVGWVGRPLIYFQSIGFFYARQSIFLLLLATFSSIQRGRGLNASVKIVQTVTHIHHTHTNSYTFPLDYDFVSLSLFFSIFVSSFLLAKIQWRWGKDGQNMNFKLIHVLVVCALHNTSFSIYLCTHLLLPRSLAISFGACTLHTLTHFYN